MGIISEAAIPPNKYTYPQYLRLIQVIGYHHYDHQEETPAPVRFYYLPTQIIRALQTSDSAPVMIARYTVLARLLIRDLPTQNLQGADLALPAQFAEVVQLSTASKLENTYG